MILLIDNYDSFSYNLYQLIGKFNQDIKVIRNDELNVVDILKLNPTHIVISPGPGFPKNAGIIEDLINSNKNIPLLGVCLGHQAICEVFGADIVHATNIMHGKRDLINISNTNDLFKNMNENINAARYHSLVAKNIPSTLEVIACDKYGEVMGVKHKEFPIYGIQFHPESIMTDYGDVIISNFLKIKGERL